MRFRVRTAGASSRLSRSNQPAEGGTPEAGFTQCTAPGATVEAVEYKEGTFIYTRKFPGNPTMEDISLMRGVARLDSSFWDWMRVVIEGNEAYREDVLIEHHHRDTFMSGTSGRLGGKSNGSDNATAIAKDSTAARTYHVHEAFPMRHKVAGDMDATASEISIMELDLSYEHFEVEEHAAP
jgi:phage tail-like protein